MAEAGEALTEGSSGASDQGAEDLYLDLLCRCLTRSAFPEPYRLVTPSEKPLRRVVFRALQRAVDRRGMALVRRGGIEPDRRRAGYDWPSDAETMLGEARLAQLRAAVVDVIRREVPGDLIETGVWRGGASILMRGALLAYGDRERTVWLADSFEGLPAPDVERYPQDEGLSLEKIAELKVSLDEVKANFARYGLLDDQVRFLPGWFEDTLPGAPVDRLAILRLDGDLYASTIQALEALYPKVSPGGYVIVDDFGAVPACEQAVEDYRRANGITDPIETIDWSGAYWIKQS